MLRRILPLVAAVSFLSLGVSPAQVQDKLQSDPLPSWNEGKAKKAIMDFVHATTNKESRQYVPPAERIATFDNDGTLWVEQPLYTQMAFALDRVTQLAPEHPEWKDKQPFQAALAGDREAMAKFTKQELLQIMAATHSGMTTDQF